MHLPGLQYTAALLLLVPFVVAGPQDYYVDESCRTKYPGFDDTVAEGFGMARTAVAKLAANTDVGMQRAYQKLFSDQNRPFVTNRLSLIGAFTNKVNDASQAAIILSCDDDDGWTAIEGQDDEWKHDKYHMRLTGELSCKKQIQVGPRLDSALQHTNRGYIPKVATGQTGHETWMDEGWQEPRTVVTICDRVQRQKSHEKFGTLAKYESKDLAGEKTPTEPSLLNAPLTSRTLLHEMLHSHVGYDPLKDKHGVTVDGDRKQYGYKKSINLPAAVQIRNPDNYAFFGQLSSMTVYRLADGAENLNNGVLERIQAAAKKMRRFLAKCRNHLTRRSDPECKSVF